MLTDIRALADHFLIALPNINTSVVSNDLGPRDLEDFQADELQYIEGCFYRHVDAVFGHVSGKLMKLGSADWKSGY